MARREPTAAQKRHRHSLRVERFGAALREWESVRAQGAGSRDASVRPGPDAPGSTLTAPGAVVDLERSRGSSAPNLDQETKLHPQGAAGGRGVALLGRAGERGPGLGWFAKWTPAAGEASAAFKWQGMGKQFKLVTDPATGELLRAWKLAMREDREWAHVRGSASDAAGDPVPPGVRCDAGCPLFGTAEVRGRRPCRGSDECRRRYCIFVADRRAAGQVRRFCRANRIDHLWTLTYRGEGQRDYVELRRHVRKFFEWWRSEVGDVPMIMVREPHPKGHGWHLHFAVPGFVSVRLVRKGWTHGSVNVQGRKAGASPRKVAGYLSKYVAKGYTPEHCQKSRVSPRAAGEHRYWVTQGFQPERHTFGGGDVAELLSAIRQTCGEPTHDWLSWDDPEWDGPAVMWLDFMPRE